MFIFEPHPPTRTHIHTHAGPLLDIRYSLKETKRHTLSNQVIFKNLQVVLGIKYVAVGADAADARGS